MIKKCFYCAGVLDKPKLIATIGGIANELCTKCKLHFAFLQGLTLQEFIDKQVVAIIVLDGNGTLQTVNEKARELFNKDLYLFKGEAPGRVFECEYAQLPEGCGQTVHCSGCAIRIAITETFASGEPVFKMRATLKTVKQGEPQEICYYISTRKRGDSIILQIEDSAE